MGTQVVEKIFSPLEPKAARTLVAEVNAMIEALAESNPDDEDDDDDDDDDDGDGSSLIDVLDDVFLEVDEAAPPSVDEVRAEAGAGLEEAALERLPSCRSTLVIEYDAGVSGEAPFVALQKLLFERVGDAVVSSGEGSQVVTVETAVSKRAKEVGKLWANTLPLGGSEPPKKSAAKGRPAKEVEVDGEMVYKRLSSAIEGRDPLAREMLKRELQNTTDAVRAYAGALMHEGAVPDPAIAKILSCSLEEVVAAREALWALLKKVR